ncbi:UbiA family prenyltransferase [Actinokineospora sp. NPDC004072]
MTVSDGAPAASTRTADPAARLGFRRRLLYLARIRRIEFLAVEVAIYLIPPLLILGSGAELLGPTYLIAFLTALCGIHFIDMTNVVADRDLDAIYKTRLSDAVYGLGVRNVRWQLRVTGAAALGLGCYLWATTGRWEVPALVAATLVLGAQYSIPPLHLKGAGIWQIPALILILYWLPMLMITNALPGPVGWPVLAAIAGFGVSQIGVVLVNTAEDWPEDEAFDIRTCVRVMGLSRSMGVATGMVAIGGGTACAAVYALGGPTVGLGLMVAAVVFTAAHVAGTWRAVHGRSIEDALQALRPRAKLVPLQIALGGWTTVAAAAFVIAGR